GRGRVRAGRPGDRGAHHVGAHRPDRRRQDLRLPARSRGAHPHRRNRHRRAVSAGRRHGTGGDLMRTQMGRLIGLAATLSLVASPAFAQTQTKIDGADTAWMIVATGIVLMMTLPGLALFYAGMVRKKNVLATMAQSLAATAIVSILWVIVG